MSAEDYLPDDWQAILHAIYNGEAFDGYDNERARAAEEGHDKMPVYENVKCPKCGGPMTPRKSKYGVFWGCKKYPECNGMRDNMGDAKESKSETPRTTFKKS